MRLASEKSAISSSPGQCIFLLRVQTANSLSHAVLYSLHPFNWSFSLSAIALIFSSTRNLPDQDARSSSPLGHPNDSRAVWIHTQNIWIHFAKAVLYGSVRAPGLVTEDSIYSNALFSYLVVCFIELVCVTLAAFSFRVMW